MLHLAGPIREVQLALLHLTGLEGAEEHALRLSIALAALLGLDPEH